VNRECAIAQDMPTESSRWESCSTPQAADSWDDADQRDFTHTLGAMTCDAMIGRNQDAPYFSP
jgi:hypothetical protein